MLIDTLDIIKILMLNQVIHIKDLSNYLVCPMQCNMNGVSLHEAPNDKYILATWPYSNYCVAEWLKGM